MGAQGIPPSFNPKAVSAVLSRACVVVMAGLLLMPQGGVRAAPDTWRIDRNWTHRVWDIHQRKFREAFRPNLDYDWSLDPDCGKGRVAEASLGSRRYPKVCGALSLAGEGPEMDFPGPLSRRYQACGWDTLNRSALIVLVTSMTPLVVMGREGVFVHHCGPIGRPAMLTLAFQCLLAMAAASEAEALVRRSVDVDDIRSPQVPGDDELWPTKSQLNELGEPPQLSRRPRYLRGWGHGKNEVLA